MTGNCIECNSSDVHAKDKCYKCYRKTYKQPTITCKNCHRERQHAAFGLCKSCHIKLHHYDKVKTYNARKYHRLSLELYKKLVNRACIFCEFDKVLELHHLDGNHDNNSILNLIAMCPNHHKLMHHPKYKDELRQRLLEKAEIRNNSNGFLEEFKDYLQKN